MDAERTDAGIADTAGEAGSRELGGSCTTDPGGTCPSDAAAAWSSQSRAHHAAAGGDCVRFWHDDAVAADYDTLTRECDWGGSVVDLITGLALDHRARILDIGAGTGTHVIPLACRFASVTAVEPAPAMLTRLRQHIADHDLDNVVCVGARWEELCQDPAPADPALRLDPPYDVVLASFSLDMDDLRTALTRMDDVCHGRVILVWHHGPQTWEEVYLDLWPDLHGRPYVPEPKSDALLAVLADMGIDPDVRVHSSATERRFPSLEAAVDHFAAEVRAGDDAAHRAVLRLYLSERLQRCGRRFVFQDRGDYAVMSWAAPALR